MPQMRLAAITAALWLTAGVLGLALALALGPGLLNLAAIALLFVMALVMSLLFAWRAGQVHDKRLAEIALAVGLSDKPGEALTLSGIVERLGKRLERAYHFKAAIAALHQPVLVIGHDGSILAVSAGATRLASGAVEGGTLDGLFGAGYLTAGGGAPEESMVMFDQQRFRMLRRPVADTRYLLELIPAGSYIEDDDLDAFATALGGGQTSFRLATEGMIGAGALRVLNGGMEGLDTALQQLESVMRGDAELPDALHGPLGRLAQQMEDFAQGVEATLSEERKLRTALEARLEGVGALIERFEAQAARLGLESDDNRHDAHATGEALAAGGGLLQRARSTNRDAQHLAGQVDLAARRTHAVVGEIDTMTNEIDTLVSAIEDVSFRTNMLALNAAVEAARAGEKGAGFAVVADEVRQLAQLTNRSAKDIRAVVSRGRVQAESGVAESRALQIMISELDAHLRNLSQETDSIALRLDEGEEALSRLAGRMIEPTGVLRRARA